MYKRSWLNRHSNCTTNACLQAGTLCCRGFNPDLRQHASIMVHCSYRMAVIYVISLPLNLASRDITCTDWNRIIFKYKCKDIININGSLSVYVYLMTNNTIVLL